MIKRWNNSYEACKYIEIQEIEEGTQEFDEEGCYLKLWREFTFINLDYLENVFQISEGYFTYERVI